MVLAGEYERLFDPLAVYLDGRFRRMLGDDREEVVEHPPLCGGELRRGGGGQALIFARRANAGGLRRTRVIASAGHADRLRHAKRELKRLPRRRRTAVEAAG